jgi:hypothetical protein
MQCKNCNTEFNSRAFNYVSTITRELFHFCSVLCRDEFKMERKMRGLCPRTLMVNFYLQSGSRCSVPIGQILFADKFVHWDQHFPGSYKSFVQEVAFGDITKIMIEDQTEVSIERLFEMYERQITKRRKRGTILTPISADMCLEVL